MRACSEGLFPRRTRRIIEFTKKGRIISVRFLSERQITSRAQTSAQSRDTQRCNFEQSTKIETVAPEKENASAFFISGLQRRNISNGALSFRLLQKQKGTKDCARSFVRLWKYKIWHTKCQRLTRLYRGHVIFSLMTHLLLRIDTQFRKLTLSAIPHFQFVSSLLADMCCFHLYRHYCRAAAVCRLGDLFYRFILSPFFRSEIEFRFGKNDGKKDERAACNHASAQALVQKNGAEQHAEYRFERKEESCKRRAHVF